MVYAQISEGVIQNRIVIDDPDIVQYFLEGYDYIIRVDDLDPEPQMGWLYDGMVFSPPPEKKNK